MNPATSIDGILTIPLDANNQQFPLVVDAYVTEDNVTWVLPPSSDSARLTIRWWSADPLSSFNVIQPANVVIAPNLSGYNPLAPYQPSGDGGVDLMDLTYIAAIQMWVIVQFVPNILPLLTP